MHALVFGMRRHAGSLAVLLAVLAWTTGSARPADDGGRGDANALCPPGAPAPPLPPIERSDRNLVEDILSRLAMGTVTKARQISLLDQLASLGEKVRLYEMVYLVYLRDVRASLSNRRVVRTYSAIDVLRTLSTSPDPEVRGAALQAQGALFPRAVAVSEAEFCWLTGEEGIRALRGTWENGYVELYILNRYLGPSEVMDRIRDDYGSGRRAYEFDEASALARTYGSLLPSVLQEALEEAERDPQIVARPDEFDRLILVTARLAGGNLPPAGARRLAQALRDYRSRQAELRQRQELPEFHETMLQLGVPPADLPGVESWQALSPAELQELRRADRRRAKGFRSAPGGS